MAMDLCFFTQARRVQNFDFNPVIKETDFSLCRKEELKDRDMQIEF